MWLKLDNDCCPHQWKCVGMRLMSKSRYSPSFDCISMFRPTLRCIDSTPDSTLTNWAYFGNNVWTHHLANSATSAQTVANGGQHLPDTLPTKCIAPPLSPLLFICVLNKKQIIVAISRSSVMRWVLGCVEPLRWPSVWPSGVIVTHMAQQVWPEGHYGWLTSITTFTVVTEGWTQSSVFTQHSWHLSIRVLSLIKNKIFDAIK